MTWLLYGLLALGVILLLARWFVAADPKRVIVALRWLGIAVVALAGAFLAMRGLWALLAPLTLGAVYFLRRTRRRGAAWGGGFEDHGSAGRTSEVTTATLTMSLDHDTGELDGKIHQGPFSGRSLADLSEPELHEFARYCGQNDPESLHLVEAYLDRRLGPDWRHDEEHGPAPEPPSAGAMSREEAFAVLGLRPGASEDEIRAAHHRLMKRVHPDQGGSTFLASKINQAKDLLLGHR